jgi:hypothetical protein
MRQEDAKRAILDVWHQEPKEHRTDSDAVIFTIRIMKERPDLMAFKCTEDPYQVIHRWLLPYTDERNPLK